MEVLICPCHCKVRPGEHFSIDTSADVIFLSMLIGIPAEISSHYSTCISVEKSRSFIQLESMIIGLCMSTEYVCK